MARIRLTDAQVSKVKPGATRAYLWDTEVPKLALLVLPSGTKSWIAQWYRDGRDVRVTLGQPPQMDVKEARRKALEALTASLATTPAAEPQNAPRSVLEASEAYVEDRLPGKPSYEKQKGLLARAVPSWLAQKDLRDVTMDDLRKVHASLASKTGAANSLVSLLRTVFNYAAEKRWIQATPFATKMDLYPKKRGKKALTHGQYKAMMQALRKRQETDDRIQWLALEAIILTGGRKSEMLTLREDEVDRRAMVIRKADHKTAHKVGAKELPLTPQLLDLLARVESWKQRRISEASDEPRIAERMASSPYVFPTPGRRSSAEGHLVNVDDDAQEFFRDLEAQGVLPAGFVIHNLRSAFISMAMAQKLPVEVVAKMVGHGDVNTTLRHYREVNQDELAEGRDAVSSFFASLG
jgi:integrase